MTSDDNEVGYGKPPKTSRFKKGTSGNPQGRPKGSQNLATLLGRVLKEKIVVTEKGKRREISKLEAAVDALVNRATSGDPAAFRQLIGLAGSTAIETEVTQEEELNEADQQVFEGILKRIAKCSKGDSHEDQP